MQLTPAASGDDANRCGGQVSLSMALHTDKILSRIWRIVNPLVAVPQSVPELVAECSGWDTPGSQRHRTWAQQCTCRDARSIGLHRYTSLQLVHPQITVQDAARSTQGRQGPARQRKLEILLTSRTRPRSTSDEPPVHRRRHCSPQHAAMPPRRSASASSAARLSLVASTSWQTPCRSRSAPRWVRLGRIIPRRALPLLLLTAARPALRFPPAPLPHLPTLDQSLNRAAT
jgi:hypothetical protein